VKLLPALALSCLLLAGGTPGTASEGAYERGVVGLEVTYQKWNEDRPWAKLAPKARNATAVLVDGPYLLTSAEMVDHATLIRLVIWGRSRTIEPRVVLVDREVNRALLAVDDSEILGDLRPVPIAAETPTSRTLRTVRWRQQQLESAASRPARLEVGRGWGGRVEHAFLHLRTDLSDGGWAEPVFDDGKLVGLTVAQSEQEIRAIPAEILHAFLERAGDAGPYAGFPALGFRWQTNRDSSVSRYLGQMGEPTGIVVRQIPWGSSGCGVLKPMDILLELDGRAIDAEGFFHHPRLGRLRFGHILVERRRPGDTVPLVVLRDGRELELQMTVRGYPAALDLIPSNREGQPPYVVAGGLVLRELDVPYLRTWGKEWSKDAPITLLTRHHLIQGGQTPERRRIVLIRTVLPAPYNVGYESLSDAIVEQVNGRTVGRLTDVIEALASPVNGFHVFDLAPDSFRGQVVLDAATFDAATAEILDAYQVRAAAHLPVEPLPAGGGSCPGDF
jgi:hypothetical protein